MGKFGTGKPERGKKHKKLKPIIDPFSVGLPSKRNPLVKNQPPRNENEQEIPQKLKFYMDKKDDLKNYKKKKRKKKRDQSAALELQPGMTKPMKPAPKFNQRRGETDARFLQRVKNETKRVLLKAKLEDHYGVELQESGEEIKVQKQGGMSDKKRERLKEHKKKKKLKKSSRAQDKDLELKFRDEVKFGEVVMEPPSLTAKPRKAEVNGTFPRPGKKSLLLKEIMEKNSVKRERGKSQKRKHMSLAQQRILDAERQKAIEQYRLLKNKKMKSS